ncbi:hypothetical protein ACFQMM_15235 [Saliphagus sp. GCM10025308]
MAPESRLRARTDAQPTNRRTGFGFYPVTGRWTSSGTDHPRVETGRRTPRLA